MTFMRTKVVQHYAFALACTGLGAWLTEATGSLIPLALGGATLVTATVPLVRAIRAARAVRAKPTSRR